MQKTVDIFKVTTKSRAGMEKVLQIFKAMTGCTIEHNKLLGGYSRRWIKICQSKV